MSLNEIRQQSDRHSAVNDVEEKTILSESLAVLNLWLELGKQRNLPPRLQKLYQMYTMNPDIQNKIHPLIEELTTSHLTIFSFSPDDAEIILPSLVTNPDKQKLCQDTLALVRDFISKCEMSPLVNQETLQKMRTSFHEAFMRLQYVLPEPALWPYEWLSAEAKATFRDRVIQLGLLPYPSTTENNASELLTPSLKNIELQMKMSTKIPSFTLLLKSDYRQHLTSQQQLQVAEYFNEATGSKFFSKCEGRQQENFISAEQADIDYLQSLRKENTYDQYLDLLKNLIRAAVDAYCNQDGNSVHVGAYEIGKPGVRPGALTSPFTGEDVMDERTVEGVVGFYLFISPFEENEGEEENKQLNKLQELSDLAIYKNNDHTSQKTTLMIIPGSWLYLMDNHLLESPDRIFSLSPRKIIPMLQAEPDLVTMLGLQVEFNKLVS